MLSGRYADVLSGLFLGYSTLWYTSHHKNVKGLDKVTDFAMQVRHETRKQVRKTLLSACFFFFSMGWEFCTRCRRQTNSTRNLPQGVCSPKNLVRIFPRTRAGALGTDFFVLSSGVGSNPRVNGGFCR